MSKYTIELRKVCDIYTRETVESWFKDYEITDFLTSEQIQVVEKTGLWNKEKLARKIVDHYYMREIGFETPALFAHYAKVTMQELMEEKLPLIYSSAIQYDPLVNVDYTETFEREQNQNTSSESSSQGTNRSQSSNNASGLSVSSDTPQGQITKANILNGSYASSTTANESESNIQDTTQNNTSSNSSLEGVNNENYLKHVKGNSGVSATAQKMIEQYRQNIIAIDKDIIKELNSLFMGLY